ncbi:hypothetical protein GT347_17120 [Xylophilus rhododendri]|uniref:Uncharacterized protein n=1 Tax=Xylophilus rhododendri TaxID=2697032 RepID=A0A857J8X3_9BURK|nr:hypothetical protein [Xylophilus rhododendri]QHI99541.1 hypothetical protein GT347_17120 [Xylophilus rhododendri]
MAFHPLHPSHHRSLPDLRRVPTKDSTQVKADPGTSRRSFSVLFELPDDRTETAQDTDFGSARHLFDPLTALLLVTCIEHLLPIVEELELLLAPGQTLPPHDPRTVELVRTQEYHPHFGDELLAGLCSFAAILATLREISLGKARFVQDDMPLFADVLEVVMPRPRPQAAAASVPGPVIEEPADEDQAPDATTKASQTPRTGPVITEVTDE